MSQLIDSVVLQGECNISPLRPLKWSKIISERIVFIFLKLKSQPHVITVSVLNCSATQFRRIYLVTKICKAIGDRNWRKAQNKQLQITVKNCTFTCERRPTLSNSREHGERLRQSCPLRLELTGNQVANSYTLSNVFSTKNRPD